MSIRNPANKAVFSSITALLFILLSACGGSGSSEKTANTDGNPPATSGPVVETPGENAKPDEIDPEVPDKTFNYIAVIKENQEVTAPLTALSTDLEDAAFVIQLQSNGFPNLISSMTTSMGDVITDKVEIEKLFVLFINPETGEVEIKVNKQFDFENDATSYQLAVTLGTESIDVLVNVYDIQKGTAAEALKINSYNELKSFFDGTFVSEDIGNDILKLNDSNSISHNTDGLYIELGQDIDASKSAESAWTGYEFDGQLNGNSFVINQLSIADGKGFINNSTRFNVAKVKNIGFVDTRLTGTLISSSAISSELNAVFLSGTVKTTSSTTIYFSSFRVAGEFKKVYTNLYYDLSSITNPSTTRSSELSAFMGSAGAPISFSSGYSNGSIHMAKDLKIFLKAGGFSGSQPDISDYGNSLLADSLFYSAIDFEVSEDQGKQGSAALVQVGGLANSYIDYPARTAENSAYNWRFITDRSMTGRVQNTGNAHRDTNNDGQGDADGVGVELDFAGMTQAQAKTTTTFSGPWTASDSAFDIVGGEYPVLKGMPYPRTEGAVWMDEIYKADPGIAYQRATYDDYQTAP